MSHRTTTFGPAVAALRRLAAACGVALFLGLTVAAASPALHHWLHADGATDAKDNCAIVLFATGVTLACAAVLVSRPCLRWTRVERAVVSELLLVSPRYVLRPERGPPAC
ncbi:MAG: hypothetical protein ABIV50_16610 [Opitutus sp.]